MSDKKTKLAIVGHGYWGSIYINTINPLSWVNIPKEFILGRNYKDILTPDKNKNVQGVILATPPDSHFEVAKYLIDNGYLNLLIEKPLTDNIKTAELLLETEKSIPESILMVSHVHLYDPAYRTMKDFAQKNLGKIKQINYISLKSKPVENSTVLKHLSPHPLSIFLDISGTRPTQVEACETGYDNIELKIKFENGILGYTKMGTTYPERKREIEIIGENGKLYLSEFLNPRELIYTNLRDEKEILGFPQESPLEMQVLEFVNCINEKRKPRTTISQGVEVVKIIELALYSLAKGSVVKYL